MKFQDKINFVKYNSADGKFENNIITLIEIADKSAEDEDTMVNEIIHMMLREEEWGAYSYRNVLAAFVRGAEPSRQEKVLSKLKSHPPSIITERGVKDVQEILEQATKYVASQCKFSKDFVENLDAVLLLPTVLTKMIKEYLGAVDKIANQADPAPVVAVHQLLRLCRL